VTSSPESELGTTISPYASLLNFAEGSGTLRVLEALDSKTFAGRDVALVRELVVERDEEYAELEENGGKLRRL